MNIISWNCRGIGQKGFVPLIKDVSKEYDTSLIFLLEVHASGERVRKFARRTGSDGFFIIDSDDQAGGIIALWRTTFWRVDVLKHSNQFLHLKVGWGREASWCLTAVYGKPQLQARRVLWDELREIHLGMDNSWAIVGDFNAILAANERSGGSNNQNLRGMLDFQELVNDCDLVDAGYQGCPFTWKGGNLSQRLDRLLVNLQWRIRFEEAVVFHLPHFKSDHRMVLIKMRKTVKKNQKRRPFRFMAAWLTHENFESFLRNTWRQELS